MSKGTEQVWSAAAIYNLPVVPCALHSSSSICFPIVFFFLSLLFSVPPISHTNFSQSEEISQFFETIINSFQFVSCKGSRKFRFLSHQELINVSQDFHLSRVSGAIDFYCSSILLSLSCYSRTQTVNFLVLLHHSPFFDLQLIDIDWSVRRKKFSSRSYFSSPRKTCRFCNNQIFDMCNLQKAVGIESNHHNRCIPIFLSLSSDFLFIFVSE